MPKRPGKSTINDERKDDKRSDLLAALAVGFTVARNQGVKLAYVLGRTQEDVGADTDTLAIAWSVSF